jgi:dTDP-4-dehydrorhamnose 3,5-epimerase
MQAQRLAIPDVILATPPRFADARGWFSEAWNAARFAEAGISGPFIQDNQSFSAARGTVRGLHCQVGANAQGKLIRVLAGRIWDVAVDIRRGSPTYGQHVAAELTAGGGEQLWIPAGFLHGFCTLEPATQVLYKVTAPYDRAAERGVIWNDSTLALPWPVAPADAVLSDKDAALPPLGTETWFEL